MALLRRRPLTSSAYAIILFFAIREILAKLAAALRSNRADPQQPLHEPLHEHLSIAATARQILRNRPFVLFCLGDAPDRHRLYAVAYDAAAAPRPARLRPKGLRPNRGGQRGAHRLDAIALYDVSPALPSGRSHRRQLPS